MRELVVLGFALRNVGMTDRCPPSRRSGMDAAGAALLGHVTLGHLGSVDDWRVGEVPDG